MLEHFKHKFHFTDEEWMNITNRFTRIEVAAKTTLLKEGEISKKFFLIEKGCIRAWFNKDGKDLTFQFFFENNTVASVESFRKQIPSPVSLETIEPSVIWHIHKKDADEVIARMNETPALRNALMDLLFERIFDYMKHFFSFIKDTPEQRYLNLLTENPQFIQRVPQHYIASYLGISTVHLSRLKSRLAKRKSSS